MNPLITTSLIALFVIGLAAFLASKILFLRKSYYFGIVLWSKWAPILAVAIYLMTVGLNLAGLSQGVFNLNKLVTMPELLLLFLIGPFFLTKYGNYLAGFAVLYLAQRLAFFSSPSDVSIGMLFLLGSGTVISTLGDKMPWNIHQGRSDANQLRGVMLSILSFGAMALVLYALLRVGLFRKWIFVVLGAGMTTKTLSLLLIILLVGWLTVALGMSKHLSLPVLCIPTLAALAFISNWPSYLLIIPVVLCLSLSLAAADRRQGPRGGFSPNQ